MIWSMDKNNIKFEEYHEIKIALINDDVSNKNRFMIRSKEVKPKEYKCVINSCYLFFL